MFVCKVGHFASAWGTLDESFLYEVRFINLFDSSGVLAQCCSYCTNSNRAPLEFVDDGAENLVVGILLTLDTGIEGMMMFILESGSAEQIVNLLMGKSGKLDEFSEMDLSALQEIGNIIAGSYLSAISAFTNMTITASVPYLSIDMAGAILSVPAIEFSKISDKALLIETEFGDRDTIINGYFILIPNLDAFTTIFSALGLA